MTAGKMTTDRALYQRARELFHAACDLSVDERARFLDERCADAPELRAKMQDLFDAEASLESRVLEQPIGAAGKLKELEAAASSRGHGPGSAPAPGMALKRVGQYRVVGTLGAGGMGVVYKAQQEHPHRLVALKVLRQGLMSDALLKRFRREADLLGRLQHPGIAHVYEAGLAEVETENGLTSEQPFFAMELIFGEPLDQYAAKRDLDERARLALMADVCDAVNHAHERGVVHRDLKPSNILVCANGRPKILDFGVSRATNVDTRTVSLETNVGQVIGTVPYMSPEQMAGDPSAIDARSDVYALGVVLYELLTGRLPHDLSNRSIPEAIRLIQEEEPQRLSSIHTRFRGDIETIVAKALEKDRDRRYASAADLAADIHRRLRDEPIQARPASALYRLRKFTRRNRPVVFGLAATFAALVTGLAATTYGLISARTERDAKQAALREEQTSREISDAVTAFFTEMLASASPAAQGRNVTVRDVLNNAAAQISNRFSQRPAIEARIRSTISKTYVALGEYDRAEEQIVSAIEIWNRLHDECDPQMLEAESLLGEVYYFQGRLDEASAVLEAVLDRSRRAFSSSDARLIPSLSNAAFIAVRTGRFDMAERRFVEALSLLESPDSTSVIDDQTVVELKANLAQLYAFMGRADDAKPIYLDLIPFAQRTIGPDHPQTILLMSNLASVYKNNGEVAEAIPLMEQTLDMQERILGEDHSQTLITLNNLADALRLSGDVARAENLLCDGFARSRRAYGEESLSACFLLLTLGQVYQTGGRLDEAEQMLSKSLTMHRRMVGEDAEGTFVTALRFIDLCLVRSKFHEAAKLAEELVEKSIATHGESHPRAVHCRLKLARAYTGLGRFDEAEKVLLAAQLTAGESDKPLVVASLSEMHEARAAESDRGRD